MLMARVCPILKGYEVRAFETWELIDPMDTRIFTALADPTRRDLLVNLAENSPRTATQLAEGYDISRQGILKHLNILEEAGLVAVYQKGREKRYTLTPEPLGDIDEWIKKLSAKWDQRLLRLKAMLESETAEADSLGASESQG